MREMKPCQHALSDVVYKEVVVIGNGPSGMVTSFMLAGNVPHLRSIPDELPIDEMLRARLSNLKPGQSLLETDLMELAEGLEGRSQNPLPLLMDNLLRPCADLGVQAESLIDWRYDVEKQIDHVVLGKGPPGGAWQTFPGSVRTLSPGAWLSLPPHDGIGAEGDESERVSARAVAAYCKRYVHACKLQRYFRSCVIVTSVSRVSRSAGPPCSGCCPRAAAFWVSGYDKCEGRAFKYACRRVVVASGGSDRPSALPDHIAPYTVTSLAAIERAIHAIAQGVEGGGDARPVGDVVVVGSGVSAADAVRLARGRGAGGGVHVRHVHRAPADALARLAPAAYPDYCQVYKMMCDGPAGDHPNYTPYPEHTIVEVTPLDADLAHNALQHDIRPKRVKLLNLVTNQTVEISASLIAVLIGSKPDLFFLQTNFNINYIDVKNKCIKCIKAQDRKCFLRNHWHTLKNMLGQSLQSCKSRLSYEINGNIERCKECKQNELKIPYVTCECQTTSPETQPYTGGLGYGLDPEKPVDGRSNPVAIDKSTHEVLNAPKGIYALGPLTADNFVRFIPGGAVALVAHMHRDIKAAE